MEKLSLDLMLNIYSYLLNSPILITDFKWDKDRIKIIDDPLFKKHIITNNIKLLYVKYQNTKLTNYILFYQLYDDVLNYNNLYIQTKHTVYLKEHVIQKLWYYNEQEFETDIIKNYQYFANKVINLLLCQKFNKYKMENVLMYIYKKILIGNLQYKVRMLNVYFEEYLDEIDYDLQYFKASGFIEYINEDLEILSHLLDE